jgi:hypothetical protein
MLRLAGTVLALLLSAMLVAPSASAALPAAEDPPVKKGECPPGTVEGDWGQCVTVSAEDPASEGSDTSGNKGGGGSGGKSGEIWLTVNGSQCKFTSVTNPQPPKNDPVWDGRTEGVILSCLPEMCLEDPAWDSNIFCRTGWQVWSPRVPGAPNPGDLAQRAVDQMNLQPIEIGIVPEDKPGSIGIVGMPQWMWVNEPAPNTFGPITQSATAGQFTVTATAKVNKTVWGMGDGNIVTCVGPGTPYEDKYDIADSPDCGYKYTKQGEYEVTATSYWTVEWEGMGQSGTIPLDLTSSTNIVMGEAQVITQ